MFSLTCVAPGSASLRSRRARVKAASNFAFFSSRDARARRVNSLSFIYQSCRKIQLEHRLTDVRRCSITKGSIALSKRENAASRLQFQVRSCAHLLLVMSAAAEGMSCETSAREHGRGRSAQARAQACWSDRTHLSGR